MNKTTHPTSDKIKQAIALFPIAVRTTGQRLLADAPRLSEKLRGGIALNFIIVLAFLVLLSANSLTAATFGNFNYTDLGSAIRIDGYVTKPTGHLEIPATIDGKPVTTIASWAFESTGLTSVVIPNSVTTIGSGAFDYCAGLTSVTIGDSVATIGDRAFMSTGLTSVVIPNSVTSIGEMAFSNCGYLTSVTIGNSVTGIGEGAFDCAYLTSFSVDSGNPSFSSLDGVLFNKTKTTLIQFPRGKTGHYTIPDSVTSIGDKAFYECSGLTSVTIPDSVTTIGKWAFFFCQALTSATIGNSVTTIEEGAFSNCGLTSLVIPNSVITIGRWAFDFCAGLTSVVIPSSVTTIGSWAFNVCSNLTDVEFLGNAPQMGDGVFDEVADGFTIYYQGEGFSSPFWLGYKAVSSSPTPTPTASPTPTPATPVEVSGSFQGLIGYLGPMNPSSDTDSIVDEFQTVLGGATLKVNPKRAFTITVTVEGQQYKGKGAFDNDGSFVGEVTGKAGALPLTLDMISPNGATAFFRGTCGDYDILLGKAVYNSRNPFPVTNAVGNLLLGALLPETPDNLNGAGTASLGINKNGVAKLAGMLPDGTKYTASIPVWAATGEAGENLLLVFINLYKGQGYVGGWLSEIEEIDSDFSGIWQWSSPASSGKTPRFAEAFATELEPALAYNPTLPKGTPLVSWENGWLILQNGQLIMPIGGDVDYLPNNKLVLTGAALVNAKVKIKLNPKTALVSGSFVHPETGKPVKFFGAFNRKTERAYGFFLSPQASGLFELGEIN